jgi:hypothetical protein
MAPGQEKIAYFFVLRGIVESGNFDNPTNPFFSLPMRLPVRQSRPVA